MNEKFERKILARGLTTSNIGATIKVDDQSFIVEDVKYQADATIVKITQYLVLPNDLEISIYD